MIRKCNRCGRTFSDNAYNEKRCQDCRGIDALSPAPPVNHKAIMKARRKAEGYEWRICKTCHSRFETKIADKEYCSDACKFFHFEAKKKSIIGKVGRI